MDGMKPLGKRHRPPRLPNYDYTAPGYYFVTFNTLARNENTLACIESVVPAALGGLSLPLTTIGEAVKSLIERTDHVYPNVRVDCYVIMPDHVHLILILGAGDGLPGAAGATTTSLGTVVNALKSLSSKEYGKPLWQAGYYDHIIRNDADLRETRQYITNNPAALYFERRQTP